MGIGLDIEETERFKIYKKITNPFLQKYFALEELEYCFSKNDKHVHLAGFFAAKEAFIKAASGTSKIMLDYSKIIVSHNKNGSPFFKLDKSKFREGIYLSITHTTKIASAVVFIK